MAERDRNIAATSAPNEVQAPPGDAEAYQRVRIQDVIQAPYRIPEPYLAGIRPGGGEAPETPLVVFINARSGGRVGADLALVLMRALGRSQVFDLSEYRPDKVLRKMWDNFKLAEAAGDKRARLYQERLRVLVAGGDGTIAWVLATIKQMNLRPAPPVAIMPLGTGNDLSRMFGWGPAFTASWTKSHEGIYNMLMRVAAARVDELDCWRVQLHVPRPDLLKQLPHSMSKTSASHSSASSAYISATLNPLASSNLGSTSTAPHGASAHGGSAFPGGAAAAAAGGGNTGRPSASGSVSGALQAQLPPAALRALSHGEAMSVSGQSVASSEAGTVAGVAGSVAPPLMPTASERSVVPPALTAAPVSAQGLFWNYLSVGLDAKSAWGFHHLRERQPGLAASRLMNQFWYSFFSCTSGWFCCTQPLSTKVSLKVQRPGSDAWEEVALDSSVRALVVLNLQSYAGGRNLWGPRTSCKSGFKEPSYNDGLLEVVGLTSGYHTAGIMASKGSLVHARRVCQAAGLRIELQAPYTRPDGAPSHCYLQVDGEPWQQDVPTDRDAQPITIEVSQCGVSKMLHNYSDLARSTSRLPLGPKGTAARQALALAPPLQVPASPLTPHHLPAHLLAGADSIAGASDLAMAGSERPTSTSPSAISMADISTVSRSVGGGAAAGGYQQQHHLASSSLRE